MGNHVNTLTMVINVTIVLNKMVILVTKVINFPMVSLVTEVTNMSTLKIDTYYHIYIVT